MLGTGLLRLAVAGGTAVRNHILTTRLHRGRRRRERRGAGRSSTPTRRPGPRTASCSTASRAPTRPGSSACTTRCARTRSVAPLVDGEALAKLWAERALDDETPFNAEWVAGGGGSEADAEVRLAPAMVLRRRERASLIGYYDAMLQALRGPKAQAPLGLAQLVTSMEAERAAGLAARRRAPRRGEVLGADPLFPLPANPEQMRIMERLRGNNGVVVQGPPGTGKTHTIANLISALLAQGQRVLVTSQKAQALRVLRDKLPAEVAKLCVCDHRPGPGRLGRARGQRQGDVQPLRRVRPGRARLQEVAGPRAAARRADRAGGRADRPGPRSCARRRRVVHPEVAPGYAGTLGEIADKLRRHRAGLGWMPVPLPDRPLPGRAADEPPLTAAEAGELLRLLPPQTPERAGPAPQRMVDLDAYPTADEVRADGRRRGRPRTRPRSGRRPRSRRRLDGATPSIAAARSRPRWTSARQAGHACSVSTPTPPSGRPTTGRCGPSLTASAARTPRSGASSRPAPTQAASAQRAVRCSASARSSSAPGAPGSTAARLARSMAKLRDHLADGGKLRGALKSREQRDAETVLEHATVDGLPVTTPEQVDAGLRGAAGTVHRGDARPRLGDGRRPVPSGRRPGRADPAPGRPARRHLRPARPRAPLPRPRSTRSAPALATRSRSCR